jgi:hypothetical protein
MARSLNDRRTARTPRRYTQALAANRPNIATYRLLDASGQRRLKLSNDAANLSSQTTAQESYHCPLAIARASYRAVFATTEGPAAAAKTVTILKQ